MQYERNSQIFRITVADYTGLNSHTSCWYQRKSLWKWAKGLRILSKSAAISPWSPVCQRNWNNLNCLLPKLLLPFANLAGCPSSKSKGTIGTLGRVIILLRSLLKFTVWPIWKSPELRCARKNRIPSDWEGLGQSESKTWKHRNLTSPVPYIRCIFI